MIADDEALSREVLSGALRTLGYECDLARDGAEAWERYQREPYDVIVSDWKMPERDGLELCRAVRELAHDRYSYFILLTATGGDENLRLAIEAGVDDYLTKPLEPNALEIRLKVAARISQLHRANADATARIETLEAQTVASGAADGLIGESAGMVEVFRRVRLAAEREVSVLITGESGTGKELIARALHRQSARADRPFLAVNCAAIPETLLESELFGHVRGAFTGADRDKVGLFEAASGGTLFLDEIGDVPLAVQVKLLRVLQEREVTRIGRTESVPVDVRLVTATNRDLAQRVVDEEFRRDFFYRIRVFEVAIPPLRARREDIPPLVDHFRERLNEKFQRSIEHVEDGAMKCLLDYPWPGNVRELENAMEYAFVVAEGTGVRKDDLPPEVIDPSLHPADFLPEPVLTDDQKAERDAIREALEGSSGNRTEAAAALGYSRVTLWKKMRRYRID